jgi:tRNA threonylcarbamoyladenosine biosynthesis protein TsaB
LSVLFIDSSYDITLGLLDDNREWLDLRTFRGQRASHTLQTESFHLLKNSGLHVKDLGAIVSIAGPGFYTGLRLSEGFSDVTKFFQVPHFSFYSYEIPAWLGHSEGAWITKAYRGEYFVFEWSGVHESKKLVAVNELGSLVLPAKVFIHSDTSLDEKLRPITTNAVSTMDLLKRSPKKIFESVFNLKLERESFYFRAPEDEFRMNP